MFPPTGSEPGRAVAAGERKTPMPPTRRRTAEPLKNTKRSAELSSVLYFLSDLIIHQEH